jgi:regulatory protein
MTENNLTNTALKKAMSLCARREYCSEDIRVKLDSWGINNPDADNIISRLIRENFINDKRYAEAFVKDKYHHNKWGKVKIASQLRAKRIASEVIDSVLATVDEDQYRQAIRDILASHRKFIKAKNQFDLKGKLMRFGLSKGFESHILYDILNDLEE